LGNREKSVGRWEGKAGKLLVKGVATGAGQMIHASSGMDDVS